MYDVIIIGGGLSGLTTAYKILQKEPTLRLIILEENETIGGQITTTKFDNELGGKIIRFDNTHVFNLLTDLGVNMRRRPPSSKNLKRCWSLDEGRFAPIAKFELDRYIRYLNLQAQFFKSGTYDLSPNDRKYTMWANVKKNLYFDSSRVFMKNLIRLVAGVDAKDISFVEFMNIVHSCGSIKALIDLYIDPSQNVLEFSGEQLLEVLESRLDTITIRRCAKVVEIHHYENYVQVTETEGNMHTSKVLVLAVPCNQIEDIFITPPVPEEWEVPCSGDKYFVTSFRVKYEESHWRRKGFSGSIYSAEPPIFIHAHNQTALDGYIMHGQGDELRVKSTVLNCLVDKFGEEMREPFEFSQHTYEQTSLLNLPCVTPWNRIVWSSTATATLYRGCLNGAVQSGLRGAMHALLILRPQSISWQDLAEIQRANAVYRYPSHWELIKSTVNVYNAVVYSLVALVVCIAFRNRPRLFN